MIFTYECDIGDFHAWGKGMENLDKIIGGDHYGDLVDEVLDRWPDGVDEDEFNEYLASEIPDTHPDWIGKEEGDDDDN